ncbi:MAG: restriction endonuclease subunit S [Methylobacter sp.]|nr:restriction endonuclease subunit S [Methylobacter sp.]
MNLKSLAILMAGHPLRGSIDHTPGGEVAVAQMKDVDPEGGISKDRFYRVNLTGRKNPDYLRQGDILFVGRGYRIFAVLVDEDLKQTVASPHFFILRIKPEKPIRPDYLVWYINHTRAQRYFSKYVAGTALPHINRQALEDLPVILPPLQIQDRIVNAHRCRLKEKVLLETLIEKKKLFLNELLDKTLEHYGTHEDSV